MKIDCFIADIRHNKTRVNPLTGRHIGLTEEGIRNFEQTIKSEDTKEVRLHGKFKYLSGRVWKMWDRGVHTFARDIWPEGSRGVLINGQPPSHWPRIMLIDPHDAKEHALLWVAKEPEYLRYYCYREAWLGNRTFGQVCSHIRDVETANREKVGYRIMDPNFGPKRQGNTKTTVREDFETESRNVQYPMRFAYGDDNDQVGRKKVADLLYFDVNKPLSIINRPLLYVCNDLIQCIYQIEHYVWPDLDESKPEPATEKPINKNDDFPALFRYLALSNWEGRPAEMIAGCGNAYA